MSFCLSFLSVRLLKIAVTAEPIILCFLGNIPTGFKLFSGRMGLFQTKKKSIDYKFFSSLFYLTLYNAYDHQWLIVIDVFNFVKKIAWTMTIMDLLLLATWILQQNIMYSIKVKLVAGYIKDPRHPHS